MGRKSAHLIRLSTMLTMSILIAAVLVTSCATTPPVPLTSGMPNTKALDGGTIVFDLNGRWDASYIQTNGPGNSDVIKISQSRAEFTGVKEIGNKYVGAGKPTIRGTLGTNGFSRLEVFDFPEGWISQSGEIRDAGNTISIYGTYTQIELRRRKE